MRHDRTSACAPGSHPPPSAGANASRETLAHGDGAKGHRYTSPFRKGQGDATRKAIIDATLKFVAEGRFRPEAREIGRAAGCDPSAITRHFGSLDLLCRVIAREHAGAVVQAAGLGWNLPDEQNAAAAWVIMTGTVRAP